MRIASLLLTAIASALMACGRSASNEVTIEKIEGGVLTELQKLSSPMVALQFTHRAQGEVVSEGFSYMAKVFQESVVDFAEVDLSDPANSGWVTMGETAKYAHAVPKTNTRIDDYTITVLPNAPESPDEIAWYFRDEYLLMLVFPDLKRMGNEPANKLHMPGINAIDAILRRNDNNNNNNHGHDDPLHHIPGTTEQGPDTISGTATEDAMTTIANGTASPVSDHPDQQQAGEDKPPTTAMVPDDRQPSCPSRKSSLKVGDTLTRPETLASADGSTTLSLAERASVMITRSATCPVCPDVNPMMPPPLPQCPVLPVIDCVDNDAKEEEASELLSTKTRRVRRVAKKKAAEGGNIDVKGPVRKFLGFFGHGAKVRGGNNVASKDKYIRGDRSDSPVQGKEGTVRADDDERNGEVPGEVKDRAAPSDGGKGKGKGVGGWFGWRKKWRGGKVEASLDDEVVMAVSDVGGLDVTYDGVRVISKSGPFRREWVNRLSRFPRGRPRSTDYALRVVDGGIEMCLGEERVWGVTVPSSCPAPDEP